ncbi:MAG: zeta toxin [Segetibacter sp.]|jgi:predicted ABC-type ATPase|nr:zeta toxin [Segetibacter sp.]
MPELYIIAGPNGAGKTTAAKTILPEILNCNIFLNADEIAAQLNPENLEAAALKAGRMMLEQIESCLVQKVSFGIETTLTTRSYLKLVKKAQLEGYEVVLLFFSLPSAKMAKERVAQRVRKGGHNIPREVIERRFVLGIRNLFEFIEIVDRWHCYENNTTPPGRIAQGERDGSIKIHNFEVWKRLKVT